MTFSWPALTSLFLAQATAPSAPPSVSELEATVKYIIIGMIVGAVPLLITCINGILTIIDRFKVNPPLHKEYATKKEVIEAEARMKAELDKDSQALRSFITRSDRFRDGLNRELRTISRQMGEIHGRLGLSNKPASSDRDG